MKKPNQPRLFSGASISVAHSGRLTSNDYVTHPAGAKRRSGSRTREPSAASIIAAARSAALFHSESTIARLLIQYFY